MKLFVWSFCLLFLDFAAHRSFQLKSVVVFFLEQFQRKRRYFVSVYGRYVSGWENSKLFENKHRT